MAITAGMASDWGFQPFGSAQDYPGISQSDGSGKRAQKSDKRRQRQLQELVSGVVRLERAGGGGNKLTTQPAALDRAVDAGAAAGAGTPGPADADAGNAAGEASAGRSVRRRNKDTLAAPPQAAAATATVAANGPGVSQATQVPHPAAAAPDGQGPPPSKKRRSRNKFKPDVRAGTAQDTEPQHLRSATTAQPQAHGAAPQTDVQPKSANKRTAQQSPTADARSHEGSQPAQPSRQQQQQDGLQQRPAGATKRKKRKRQQEQHLREQPAGGTSPAAQPSTAAEPSMADEPSPASVAGQQPATDGAAARPAGVGGGSGLLDKMRGKLQGGRFRWLNEQLYTSTGGEALRMMQEQPDLYSQYHEGFRRQAADWPQQPLDAALSWLEGKPKDWVVADFGCGDAQVGARAAQKVHGFDLVATAPGVTACNMADVPLSDGSVDAVVFCLALMGTDYGEFLREAHRVLKPGGWLWICEVRSRFTGQSAGDSSKNTSSSAAAARDGSNSSSGTQGGEWIKLAFTRALQKLGFKLAGSRVMNKMFVVFELRKAKAPAAIEADVQWPALKASVYKKQ